MKHTAGSRPAVLISLGSLDLAVSQLLKILYDSAVVVIHVTMDLEILHDLIELCGVGNRNVDRMSGVDAVLDVLVVDADGGSWHP